MNSYELPCHEGTCARVISVSLCKNFAKTIVVAGGAGVFEATPCPMEALTILATATGEQADILRQNLGIVGVTGTYEA